MIFYDNCSTWTKAAQHWIELSSADAQPVPSLLCRAGSKTCKVQKNKGARMPDLEVIELARAGWASVIFLAHEKDFPGDSVSSSEKPMNFQYGNVPISPIDECTDALRDVIIFYTLHVNHAYWREEIAKGYSEKTCFCHLKDCFISFLCRLDWTMQEADSNVQWTSSTLQPIGSSQQYICTKSRNLP